MVKLIPIRANMTEVETERYLVLFSYQTPVAYLDKETGKLFHTRTKYSKTTSKHINQWLDLEFSEPVNQEVIDNLL